MILVDEANRRRAMTDFKSILLVEAAAGTGKTSLIAGRIAMMLASGHLPGEIAAITFTELAASQLAQRIRETVDSLLADIVPDFLKSVVEGRLKPAQRTALEEAASQLDELTATTIHGFCQTIIQSHGIQAGLDPGARVADANVADALFLSELSALFSRRLAADAPDGDPIVALAAEMPLRVVALVRELAFLRREHPDARPVPPQKDARPDIDFAQAVDDFDRWQASAGTDRCAPQIARDLQRLKDRCGGLFGGVPTFAALWKICDPRACRLFTKKGLELVDYREAAELFGSYHNEDPSEAALERYALVQHAWKLLVGHIASTLVCALSSSLDQLLDGYRQRKLAAAVLDFDDLILHVRSLIRTHEDVRRAIGRRYKHILVDEFQDTDQVQNEILFSIATGDDRPERWQEGRLRPGSLFLVGDPKQAIYRFRGADIEAYDLSRRLIETQEGGAIIEVTANFRSQCAIVRHVNTCFEPIFSLGSQPRFVALAPTVPDASYPMPCVTRTDIHVTTQGKVYADMLREAEAERVADICARLIGNINIRRANGASTPLRAGDIALLSPTHTELWRYERALEERRLAVSSQAGLSLMRRQETQDILALLRVLTDSSDTLAFGALMRGPLVGITEQDLLDITAALPSSDDRPTFFDVRTDPFLVQHPVAQGVLRELQHLRRRASISTPSLVLAEAIERLNARVIMAARHRNRNARALANLDALVERARRYGVAGLRAFARDLQADWERKTRAEEGRIDSAAHAIEIVTIHKSKGLEWPVVIPINSTTELYSSREFVYRQSDNSLHWRIGGIEPPHMAAARLEESQEDANQRERIWYVACTRARDLLILPSIRQAPEASWLNSIDLKQDGLPELDLAGFSALGPGPIISHGNGQSADVFAAEQQRVAESAPPIAWRRPSDHDQDRIGDPLGTVVLSDALPERMEVVGAGARRGIVLHKLMEELITGELNEDEEAAVARAGELLTQLIADDESEAPSPSAAEMAKCALRALALPEIAELRPSLVPEVAIWSAGEGYLLAGRADALAVKDGRVEVAIDWKSDVNPSGATRNAYREQLSDYVSSTGAARGLLVFLTSAEVAWTRPQET